MEVTVAMPEVDSLTLRKTYPGYTEATQEADVVARVNGHITRKYFDDGQYVAAGAPLFEIESTTYRDQVARACHRHRGRRCHSSGGGLLKTCRRRKT